MLVGYAMWTVVTPESNPQTTTKHVEIAWFGIHSDYQDQLSEEGELIAVRLLATIETDALAGERSDLPLTLACHVENDSGRKFWIRNGYEYDVAVVIEARPEGAPAEYRRMVRTEARHDEGTVADGDGSDATGGGEG